MNTTKGNGLQLTKEMQEFNKGEHFSSYQFLGNKSEEEGCRFTVWAPNAKEVSLVGDFSNWNPISMEFIEGTGAWTCLAEHAKQGDCYKYKIEDKNGKVSYKIDPYARAFEMPPKDASLVYDVPDMEWKDSTWMRKRKQKSFMEKPLNIYEVHPSSWRMHPDGRYYTFEELADSLIPYVSDMGYSHIEFMPLTDHPLDASWGYQITGYYAVSKRYGDCEGLQHFVDKAHQAGVGVIMDWVPGHFCRNEYALAYYDGTATFEYENYDRANNIGWGTLNFDLGKNQVHSFLISNALYWLKEFHLDGLRVDAVSNMLYLDFGGGPWMPNEDGSNHNREGVHFLQKLNKTIAAELPDVMMIAEESTAWQDVTGYEKETSLGFHYKWNMGWMNDTLKFFEMDPDHRFDNFKLINFNFVYMFNENFVMPISHDEVVHGKHSLLGRMAGDRYKQFAQLRLLEGYMIGMPGKKLNFMGNELGQFLEWRFYEELEWSVLGLPFNSEYQHYIKTINHLYLDQKALHQLDNSQDGITVLEADYPRLIFYRHGIKERDLLLFVYNFSQEEIHDYPIGVPYKGTYEVIVNSEMKEFGGAWETPHPLLKTSAEEAHGKPHSLQLIVPSMSMVVIKPKRIYQKEGR